jgi:hypothetical protein
MDGRAQGDRACGAPGCVRRSAGDYREYRVHAGRRSRLCIVRETVSEAGVRNSADIERVLAEFAHEPNGGLIVTPSPLTAAKREVIIAAAARLHLPAIYSFGFYTESGGLISYGIDQTELVREAASYIDRILRGAKPGELPVQLPTKYQLVINAKTAAALGLAIPTSMQLLADRVIDLHFHELIHVVQWRLLGAEFFIAMYAGGLEKFGYRNNPLEKIAYDAQELFDRSTAVFDAEKFVSDRLAAL